ncbi:hypothetical protein [Thiocapsa sp.]
MFRQEIRDGYQVEGLDNWLFLGNPPGNPVAPGDLPGGFWWSHRLSGG